MPRAAKGFRHRKRRSVDKLDAKNSAVYGFMLDKTERRLSGSSGPKGVKRATDSEYSLEFSAKVFNGRSRLIELGFRQGGPAGYGRSFCALQVVSLGRAVHAVYSAASAR